MQSESIQRCLIPNVVERRRVMVIASRKVCERSCSGIDVENMGFVDEVRVITFEWPQQWLNVTYCVLGNRSCDRHKKGGWYSSPTSMSLFGKSPMGKSCLLQWSWDVVQ